MEYIRKITVKDLIKKLSANKRYVLKNMDVDDFRKVISGENNHLSVYGIINRQDDCKDDIAITLLQMQNNIQDIEYVLIDEKCLTKLKIDKPEKDVLVGNAFISDKVVHYNILRLTLFKVIKLIGMFANKKYCTCCKIAKKEIIDSIKSRQDSIKFELFSASLLRDVKKKTKGTSVEQKCDDAINKQSEVAKQLFEANNPSIFVTRFG